jgi:hypothetical protein
MTIESTVMRSSIRTDQKYKLLDDGSLMILNVSAKDSLNYYICEGANGVGSGIQKSIRLTVIGKYVLKSLKYRFCVD